MLSKYLKFAVAGIIAVLIIVCITFIPRIGKGAIQIVAVPTQANIIIDGKAVTAGTHYLKPGKYAVQGSLDHFISSKRTVTVTKKHQVVYVALGSSDSTGDALSAQEKNMQLYLESEKQSGEEVDAEGTAFATANPITKLLPYKSLVCTISYGVEKDHIYLKIIASNPYARRYAIDQIRRWGYEPSNFVIRFEGYTNPLGAQPNV